MENKVCLSMATYKNYDFLQHVSLPSLIKQTHKNWVCYLTSDGINNTVAREICESFGDDRIVYSEVDRVLPDPPFPIGSGYWCIAGYNAVNHGLKRIHEEQLLCKYIAHCDDDDYWKPEHLEICIKTLEENKNAALTYTTSNYYAEDCYQRNYGDIPFDRNVLLAGNFIAHSSIVYKKSAKHTYYYSGDTSEPSDYAHLKSFTGDFVHTDKETVLYFQRCSLDFANNEILKC
jgi:hypothetical protein